MMILAHCVHDNDTTGHARILRVIGGMSWTPTTGKFKLYLNQIYIVKLPKIGMGNPTPENKIIPRTPLWSIFLDPRMSPMGRASVWDGAWLSLPVLWMFSSRTPDSWDFREVRRFESSWWAVNSVWLILLNKI